MPATQKEIKQRLHSIKNTKKITKAMELVAAAKMRKAVAQALDTRNYHSLAWGIVDRLRNSQLWFSSNNPVQRFFTDAPTVRKTTIIVMTSNKGLCGAFNSNVIKKVIPIIKEKGKANVDIICVGTRGASTLSAFGYTVSLAYKKDETALSDTSVREIAAQVYQAQKNEKTDEVYVAYTDYKSAITQTAVCKKLYPFAEEQQVGADTSENAETPITAPQKIEYAYEPDKYALLDHLVQRITQAELYQAVLESNASEHSARMLAMKNATDAATEMSEELLLMYNKARQASITQEIAEISAGSAAVS